MNKAPVMIESSKGGFNACKLDSERLRDYKPVPVRSSTVKHACTQSSIYSLEFGSG